MKDEQKLRPLTAGIDFLGYVVFPYHTVVRRRVVAHVRAKLAAWEQRPGAQEQIRSVVASYLGHFRHARHFRLMERLLARFPWIAEVMQ